MRLWEIGFVLGGSFLIFLSGLLTGWWLKATSYAFHGMRVSKPITTKTEIKEEKPPSQEVE